MFSFLFSERLVPAYCIFFSHIPYEHDIDFSYSITLTVVLTKEDLAVYAGMLKPCVHH